jgi:type IV pilus assembly protein PilV
MTHLRGERQEDGDKARRRAPSRGGFTLVEVIVAVVVLAVGVLGLAGTTTYIIREITLANMMTQRSIAVQNVIERLQAVPFDSVGTGSDSIGFFGVTWTSTNETSRSKIVTIVTSGPGVRTAAGNAFPSLGSNVPDTFQYRVIQ